MGPFFVLVTLMVRINLFFDFFYDGDSDSFDDACGLAFFNDEDAVVCFDDACACENAKVDDGLAVFCFNVVLRH